MATKQTTTPTIDEMLPLLHSIQAEINDRLAVVAILEKRLQAFLPTRHVHGDELYRTEAELATQRRELRLIAKELARLGVSFDAEHPHPIVTPARSTGSLEESGFRPWMADSRA